MTINGNVHKEKEYASNYVQDDKKRVGDGVEGDGLGSSRGDALRIDSIFDAKDESRQAVQGQGVVRLPQQQLQGSLVHWETFLNIRSIRVLLVENDDSTRHIVTALLRNSNYEVIEAANSLQAWKILEDLTSHIDIVLTEVVMPCLSGFGLLCKIMSHKTRKTIPVIMMSSHDSMGLVFKCLTKGAVDFLVKPIRKNELRNLWQHVWRRCHSVTSLCVIHFFSLSINCLCCYQSSGSGSESGTQTQKSIKSKSCAKSFNNSDSNDGEDDGSTSLNDGDGSDNGSGVQSSWTKQAVENDSSQPMSPLHQNAECPDSTCAQVISLDAEVSGDRRVPMTATRELQAQEQHLENVVKGKELIIGKPRNFESRPESPIGVPIKLQSRKLSALSSHDFTPSNKIDAGTSNPSGENPSDKHEPTNMPYPQSNSGGFEDLRDNQMILETNTKTTDDSKKLSSMKLSLKRLRAVEDTERTVQTDRNILQRSELSAFSRYDTTSNTSKAPNGLTGSTSLLDNNFEIVKKGSTRDVRSNSNGKNLYQNSQVNNYVDMGSTNKELSANQVFLKFESEATSTIHGVHPPSSMEPVLVKADDIAPSRSSHQELPVQHIHHHHHHHHFHNMKRQQLLFNHDGSSTMKLSKDAPHRGSSNVLDVPVNPENNSFNISASGSKHGSNGQNGGSTAVNAGGPNAESDDGLAGKTEHRDVGGSGSGSQLDQNKFSQRESALTKFRQKRKDRCFGKKVRYHNRKRLAEQRPRVRAQFARQVDHDSSNSAADS
ncbi:hypothetical protein RJ639_021646 [Escallonia herrerae]|uniref:Two-component response regulator-like APRR7 n=1 Tax=Escallonia herrerae TaxID=1293975 RepID=A0AA88V5D9_9ASTE|nr:hypothetical protein RJ639_021646 [Escallonia herrerae]